MALDSGPGDARFDPPPGIGHAHLQSLLSGWPLRGRVLRARAAALLGAATSEILDCGDGVRLAGELSAQPDESRGLVILLHGWEGCAGSNYMLSAGSAAYVRGFDVFRMNFRDHGGTHSLNEDLFHSCRIDEVVDAVEAVIARYGRGPTMLVGHSLGGNFALRVAARAGARALALDRVLAVCPVLSPRATMQALESGLWVYRRYFLDRWRRSLREKAACFPARYDFGDLRRFPTLTATTAYFVAEYTDFPSLDSYLDGYSVVGPVLEGLSVPTRIIVAADDPVIPVADVSRLARAPALEVTAHARGGHCAFLDSYRLGSWLDAELGRELGRLAPAAATSCPAAP